MADKEIEVKVIATSDTEGLLELNTVIEETQNKAEETGETLKTAFQEAQAEVEELTQTLADIEMGESDADFDEISEKLEEATSRAEELGDALNNLDGSGMESAKSDADDLADGLDNAKSNADELADSMGLIESTMLMDMANQIGALGDNAEGMAQDINTASISIGQLATNVGMAEPQMVNLINYISNATFPQEEAMAYVNALNQMGVSADKLGDSATNMDRINDATGIGYQKVMQLTAGLQAVGISADNLPSSFNAIAYAEANVFDGTSTLAQILKTQAGTINEYGLNVDQLVVILSTLQSQTGLTGRKLASELSSRLKECNGDVGALEQSLGMANGTLQNASQITSQYDGQLQNLADEEAEHKTWIDLINAGWEDMQLTLAPILSPLASFVGLIGSFGQTALAVNSLITLAQTFGILTTAEETATIAQMSLNLSMLANPALWLVIAIVALIGILIYLYMTNEDVRNAIDNLGNTFMEIGQLIWNGLVNLVNNIIQTLQGVWNYITTLGGLLPANINMTGNQIVDTIMRVMLFVATLPIQLQIIFINTIAKVLGFGDNFVQNMINAGLNAVNNFLNQIRRLPQGFNDEINQIIQNALNFAGRIGDILWQAGINAITGFLGGLDRNSPGKMQREFIAEITEMGERVPEASRKLIGNVGWLGEEITDNFKTNLTDGEFANGSVMKISNAVNPANTGGDIIINIAGDVDSDKRINQIVEVIRQELSWDNKTAGRSV